MSEDINIGAISEALNDKADRDLVNSIPPYLKTTYVNGTSGYNIWSNGYCEQWGGLNAQSSWTKVTIDLIKTFKDTNYNIVTQVGWQDKNYQCGIVNIYNSSFQIDNISNGYTRWKVSGYLAEGEY